MTLELLQLAQIRYTKDNEVTERTIIPTLLPVNIKAIDVSDLPEFQREEIASLYKEYSEYLNQHLKTAFSFENWLAMTRGVDFTPKWRTFKPDQLEVIE